MSGSLRRPLVRLMSTAATCTVLVLLAACGARAAGAGSGAQVASSRGAVKPSQLRRGQLTLHACLIGGGSANALPSMRAYCTMFPVPEDWAAPAVGRRIALKVALVTAQADTPDTDVVTFLDGGPGGAATEDYPAIAVALEPLHERHDILLIDQRGTGGSNPLDCPQLRPAASTPDDEPLAPDPLGTNPHAPDPLAPRLQACLAQLQNRASPQFYTTSEAVRDLEAVREALGDGRRASPRLDLVGISYGTRLAQQYARRYPSAVRSIVLDSPVPNTLALLSEHARNLERVLRAVFAQCQAQPACAARFGDSYATLYRLRDRLRTHPQLVQLRDPVSFEPLQLTVTAADLAAVVRFYAYSPLTAALLPLMLHEADQGNYAPLLGQKKWLADDLGDQITGGLELSVICAEDADLLTARPADADTLLGNAPIARAKAACALWPKGSRPADFHAPLRSALPVLVLSGELDPVTPPAYGRQILATLSHARLLIAPGQGHGVINAGCMPRLVARFVATLDPAGLDADCLDRLGEVPAFVDYNGAEP